MFTTVQAIATKFCRWTLWSTSNPTSIREFEFLKPKMAAGFIRNNIRLFKQSQQNLAELC